MDDKQRVALVETRTQGNETGVPQQLIRYQFGNHVGSASMEFDDQGQIISYEEYTPYGSTSYQAVRSQTETPKRYRYTGKERDEESGFYYHGARYYASWCARWTACDPAEIRAKHQNLYEYVSNNPVRLYDPTGREGETAPASKGFWGHAADVASGVWSGGKEAVVGIKDLAVGAFNVSLVGMLVDREQWEESNRKLEQTVSTIVEDPKIVWDAMKEPYVKAWNEGRPGEAIGRGVFEVVSIVAGTKGADKLAKGSKLSGIATKTDDIARIVNKSDDVASIVNKGGDVAKAANKVDDTVKIANKADDLPGTPKPTSLSPARLVSSMERHVVTQNQRMANAIRSGNRKFFENLGMPPKQIDILMDPTRRMFAAQYGNAMERAVGRAFRSDPNLSGMIIDARNLSGRIFPTPPSGRPLRPDFGFTSGPLEGHIVDLTTTGGRGGKMAKYHDRVITLEYARPTF